MFILFQLLPAFLSALFRVHLIIAGHAINAINAHVADASKQRRLLTTGREQPLFILHYYSESLLNLDNIECACRHRDAM